MKGEKRILLTVVIIIVVGGAVLAGVYFGNYNFMDQRDSPGNKNKSTPEEKEDSANGANKNSNIMSSRIDLPKPIKTSSTSVEEAITNRRSVRSYGSEALSLQSIAQLLWAAQGVTGPADRKRAAPSAGALYPLEVYAVVDDSPELDPGVYHYLPESHELELVREGSLTRNLAEAALGQMFVAEAPASIVITGDYSVTTRKYGERGRQYVHMEAGHAAENLFLQAVSLDLKTVTVGAFYEDEMKNLLRLPEDETPFYIMPVGK
ncbi:MAG TPA: SagB/ThcOx family dehydrogenase [Patescibacteria group bacterium]|nr:SagB/ThcOx family dehydrogenase [Patescibacteria group bacterium]